MWRRKHNRRSSVSAACLPRLVIPPGASRHSSRSSLRFSVSPACLPHMPPTAVLVGSSSHPLVPPSAARLSHRLIGSPSASYRPAPRPIRQAERGGTIGERSLAGGHRRCADGGERRTDGGVCLLTSNGDGLRAIIDGGWLQAAGVGVAACLPRGDGRSGSIVSLIVSLFLSSAHPIGSAPAHPHHLIISSSSHLIDGEKPSFSFFARPPPACSSRLACLDLFPRPRPGDVRVAAWIAAAGRGLLACVLVSRSALSLLLVRSLLYALRRSCRCSCSGAS